jgi:uncharacterized Tic20 family protein
MAYEDLEKLDELRQKGVITDAEFQAEKAKILAGGPPPPESTTTGPKRYWGMDENGFCMLLHLAGFANLVVPLGGLALPLVMWAMNKDASPVIDAHGRNIIDWLISSFIYGIVSAVLCLVIIGIPLLIALVVCDLVFRIMGAVKANKGVVWRYPLSIRFVG